MPGKNTHMSMDWLMACGHIIRYQTPYPEPNDMVFCRRCGDYTLVLHADGWQIRCDSCSYSKLWGHEEHKAGRSYAKHKATFVTHSIRMYHNGEQVAHLGNYGTYDELEIPGVNILDDNRTEIPF